MRDFLLRAVGQHVCIAPRTERAAVLFTKDVAADERTVEGYLVKIADAGLEVAFA